MKRLHQLQNRQAAILKTLGDLSDKLAAEDREHTEEELATQTRLTAELEALKPRIADEEKLQNEIKELANKPNSTFKIHGPEDHNLETEKPTEIRFPKTARVRNFKGPDALRDAYTSGKFFLATLFNNEDAKLWCRDHGIETLAQREGTNTIGGYSVPEQFESAIIDLRETYGVFRRNTRVVQMTSDTWKQRMRTAGLTGYWLGEGDAITASQKTGTMIRMSAKKRGILTYLSNEVNDDSLIGWMDDLAGEMAYEFAYTEDLCGFIGDGTSTYAGMEGVAAKINNGSYAGSISTAASGHTGFETLTLTDFHNLTGKLPQYARPRAKFYVSAAGFANAMERLMYAGGGNTTSNISGGTGLSFLGYPVEISQVLNSTLGADVSKIKLLFGDLAMASVFGDRKGISVKMSEEVGFTTDELAIRGIERFDLNVHSLGDGTAAGPIVALKTPGS